MLLHTGAHTLPAASYKADHTRHQIDTAPCGRFAGSCAGGRGEPEHRAGRTRCPVNGRLYSAASRVFPYTSVQSVLYMGRSCPLDDSYAVQYAYSSVDEYIVGDIPVATYYRESVDR